MKSRQPGCCMTMGLRMFSARPGAGTGSRRIRDITSAGRAHEQGIAVVRDPVCGRDVDERKSTLWAKHEGRLYVFCSPACRDEFLRNPEKYPRGKRFPATARGEEAPEG